MGWQELFLGYGPIDGKIGGLELRRRAQRKKIPGRLLGIALVVAVGVVVKNSTEETTRYETPIYCGNESFEPGRYGFSSVSEIIPIDSTGDGRPEHLVVSGIRQSTSEPYTLVIENHEGQPDCPSSPR